MPPRIESVEVHLPLKPLVFQILLSLAEGERHGWASCARFSSGMNSPGIMPGNFYRTLRSMLADDFIEESTTRPSQKDDDERRRYFQADIARRTCRSRRGAAAGGHRGRGPRETPARPVAQMNFYRVLLLAFPRQMRREFGDDMVSMFDSQLQAASDWSTRARLWFLAVADALVHGMGQRLHWIRPAFTVVIDLLRPWKSAAVGAGRCVQSVRISIRGPSVRRAARHHVHRRRHARARHWSQHGDLLRRRRDSPAASPLRRTRSARHGLGESPGRRRDQERRRASRLHRLGAHEYRLRVDGGEGHVDGRSGPARANLCVWSPAVCRRRSSAFSAFGWRTGASFARTKHRRPSPGRDPLPRSLAAPLRRRSLRRRTQGHVERIGARNRRRPARIVRVSRSNDRDLGTAGPDARPGLSSRGNHFLESTRA